MDVCKNEGEALDRLEGTMLKHSLPGFSPGSPICEEVLPFLDWFVREDVLRWGGGVYHFNPEGFMRLRRRHARGESKEPPSMGELAADAEMETGCAPGDAAQVAIEHLIDKAGR